MCCFSIEKFYFTLRCNCRLIPGERVEKNITKMVTYMNKDKTPATKLEVVTVLKVRIILPLAFTMCGFKYLNSKISSFLSL